MNADHVVAFFSDIKVILGTLGAGVVLTMQVLTFTKQMQTRKDVRHNSASLHKITHVLDDDIRDQLAALRRDTEKLQRTSTHLEALFERRQTQTPEHPGRRYGDVRAERQPPPIAVEPLHDPKVEGGRTGWPIND